MMNIATKQHTYKETRIFHPALWMATDYNLGPL